MSKARIQQVCSLVIFSMFASLVMGQFDALKFQFANGDYDIEQRTYTVDIQVMAEHEHTTLHAMNARFFYEAELLELSAFRDFKEGYGFVNGQDETNIGGKDSAKKMFGLAGKAGYVNQGIALLNVEKAEWAMGKWQKLVSVQFEVKESAEANFVCPSFIWDKNIDQLKGGYLKGSMGATASTISNADHKMKCNSATCGFTDFNWSKLSESAPFGLSDKNVCLESKQGQNEIINNIELFQNLPNPFIDNTVIGFQLSKKGKVTISVFNEIGTLFYKHTDLYEKGKHQINIDENVSLASGTYLYKMETDGYVSDYKKMIKFE